MKPYEAYKLYSEQEYDSCLSILNYKPSASAKVRVWLCILMSYLFSAASIIVISTSGDPLIIDVTTILALISSGILIGIGFVGLHGSIPGFIIAMPAGAIALLSVYAVVNITGNAVVFNWIAIPLAGVSGGTTLYYLPKLICDKILRTTLKG